MKILGICGSLRKESWNLKSEGAFVLHQPRVLLPQVANFMDESGNITDPEVNDLLDQAAAQLVWFTERISGADN